MPRIHLPERIMNSKLVRAFTVSAIAAGIATMAHAQESSLTAGSVDVGKNEYDTRCAICHGLSGKGDGPYVQLLKEGTDLPNLTELSKKNGGVYPFLRVYWTIDGTVRVRAHGSANMPIWGQVYKFQSHNLDPLYDPELFARTKIFALTEYVWRLQAK
jgi:mono/diheme cytochrome c family protein